MNNPWKLLKRIMVGLLVLVLVLTAATFTAGAFAKSQLSAENPPPGRMINVGGYNLHLYCTGEGNPTVIFEAGLNDFSVTWATVQPKVAKVTRVCSYDRAGLGWSQTSPYPRTNEIMAEELHTLLVNAGISGPLVLVGHSFGGINMRAFTRRYPANVSGMVLVDSAHEQQGTRLPFLKETADQFIGQFRTLSLVNGLGLIALSPGMVPNHGLPDEAYRQYQAVLGTTKYFDGAIAETSAFYSHSGDTPQVLGDLPLTILRHSLPDLSLGLTASQQVQFEQEWAKMQTELAGLSSNSKQVVAEKSAHYIQLDQPELVIEAILELVK